MPRVVGGYWDFLRIAGRARSHTTDRKWETFRLFGTLEGHLAACRHPELPEEITSPVQAASLTPGTRVLDQPRHPRPPGRVGSWSDYTGPLLLVFNGGPASRAGELVLPVRLPQGAGGPRLELPAALGMALTPESRTAYDEHLFAEATPSIPAANDATTPWCRVR